MRPIVLAGLCLLLTTSCGGNENGDFRYAEQAPQVRTVKRDEEQPQKPAGVTPVKAAIESPKEIAYIHKGACFGCDSINAYKNFGTFKVVSDAEYEKAIKKNVPHDFSLREGTQIAIIRELKKPHLFFAEIKEGSECGKKLYIPFESVVRQSKPVPKMDYPDLYAEDGSKIVMKDGLPYPPTEAVTKFRPGQVVQLSGNTHLFASEKRWMDETREDQEKAMAGTDPTLLWLEGGARMKLIDSADPMWKVKIISPCLDNDTWWVRGRWLEEIAENQSCD
jgi:hypothetical protein